MALTKNQIKDLESAISNYKFPAVYFDFKSQTELKAADLCKLEPIIRGMLLSRDLETTKYGLANVIYWGNANAGYQKYRTQKFLDTVSTDQIKSFQSLVLNNHTPTLKEIRLLKMPQFSGISFISKVIMFINPKDYCVLDLLLARMQIVQSSKAIPKLKIGTQIATTNNNCDMYLAWCTECRQISNTYFNGKYRAVDIERGFFFLIQDKRLTEAQELYFSA